MPLPVAPPDAVAISIEWMSKHFDAEAAIGCEAVFEVTLQGEGQGEGRFLLRVEGGVAQLERGADAAADVRFRLSAADWLGVLAGRENPDLLYLAGRLDVAGDLSLAMKLRTLFRSS